MPKYGERNARSFHDQLCRKPATTFARKDWLSGANRASLLRAWLRAVALPGSCPRCLFAPRWTSVLTARDAVATECRSNQRNTLGAPLHGPWARRFSVGRPRIG